MSQSEVFRPTNGPLVLRSTMADGNQSAIEMSRPATQGGYRFGQLSRNSFFTRHNPHPNRVRHIKGLLDVPICSVNDRGFFANPRYSLQFPPDTYNQKQLSKSWDHRLPVNAINVNSQLHPINTITGLAYFTGLRNYPWREKAIPKVGLVPVTEAWRDELKNLAVAAGLFNEKQQEDQKPDLERRPKTVYSAETGRLIPPPSRAMSRGGSRWGNRFPANLQHIAAEPDPENMVLTMLCQILQTDDINAVQAWLCSAGDREKNVVLDLIRSATLGREEYYKQHPAQFVDPVQLGDKHMTLPPIGEKNVVLDNCQIPENFNSRVDRLSLDEGQDNNARPQSTNQNKPLLESNEDVAIMRPPSADVFQKKGQCQMPLTSPPKSPIRQRPETSDVRLRYTKTPTRDTRPDSAEKTDHFDTDCNPDTSSHAVNTF